MASLPITSKCCCARDYSPATSFLTGLDTITLFISAPTFVFCVLATLSFRQIQTRFSKSSVRYPSLVSLHTLQAYARPCGCASPRYDHNMKSFKLLAALMSAGAMAFNVAANVSTIIVASPVATITHTNVVFVTESAGPNVDTCLSSTCAIDNCE